MRKSRARKVTYLTVSVVSPFHRDCVWSQSESVLTLLPCSDSPPLSESNIFTRLSANYWLFSSAKYLVLKARVRSAYTCTWDSLDTFQEVQLCTFMLKLVNTSSYIQILRYPKACVEGTDNNSELYFRFPLWCYCCGQETAALFGNNIMYSRI